MRCLIYYRRFRTNADFRQGERSKTGTTTLKRSNPLEFKVLFFKTILRLTENEQNTFKSNGLSTTHGCITFDLAQCKKPNLIVLLGYFF